MKNLTSSKSYHKKTHTIKTESDFYLRVKTGFGRKKPGISVFQLWRSKTQYFQTNHRVKALWRLRQNECVELARMLNTGQALGVIQRPGRKPVFFFSRSHSRRLIHYTIKCRKVGFGCTIFVLVPLFLRRDFCQ